MAEAVKAKNLIKVPEKVVAIEFLDEDELNGRRAGYNLDQLFHKVGARWYTLDEEEFEMAGNVFVQGYLDPITGQLIVGNLDINENYDSTPSLRNPVMTRWGAGNRLGGLYTLTQSDLENRLGNNGITVGQINLPGSGSLVTHDLDKRDFMQPGDKVVCLEHSGDCFFDYQLLHEFEGDLFPVEGMRFGAYTLSGDPTEILRINYKLKK